MNPFTELIPIYASLFIAVVTVIFVIKESRANKKHNRLSVRPILMTSAKLDRHTSRFTMTIENNGLGPAILVKADLIYKGETININNPSWLINQLDTFGLDDSSHHPFKGFSDGTCLPAGGMIQIFDFDLSGHKTDMETLSKEYSLRIAFEDIYGQRFYLK